MKQILRFDPKFEPIEDVIDSAKCGQLVIINEITGKVVKVLTKCEDDSLTEQSHGEMCQIKRLVADVEKQGLLRAGTKFEGVMDDFPAYDFQEAQFMMAKARNMFEAIPSAVRAKFENDPAKFADFASNPDNAKAMIDMGLARGIDGVDNVGVNTTQSDGSVTKDVIKSEST